jgi:glycosyltransferase involved in cell wall biosynthesis
MINVYLTYQFTNKPWGGANNFIRLLFYELNKSGDFLFANSFEESCDIVLMNQLSAGPGRNSKKIPLNQIEALRKHGAKIIVRAINLNKHAHGIRSFITGWFEDRRIIKLLNLADFVIFQSQYQKEIFIQAGYKENDNNAVIHNGASEVILQKEKKVLKESEPLRLISSSASPRRTKRHDLIAKLSLEKNIEIKHLGRWPKNVKTENVKLLGMQSNEKIRKELKNAHYFLHPAIKDPCPNVIFEAICNGIPVIYNPGAGSSEEIVGDCGIPLDEFNLGKTIEGARDNFAKLRRKVMENQWKYTIQYSAKNYAEVLKKCVKAK